MANVERSWTIFFWFAQIPNLDIVFRLHFRPSMVLARVQANLDAKLYAHQSL